MPYLPLLPTTSTAEQAHTACGAHYHLHGYYQFAELAAERVCLDCASPLNRCGHTYYSLRRDAVDTSWTISTSACACGTCHEQVEATALSSGSDGIVIDRRARMAQRHNTELLDKMLGVDEPPCHIAGFVKNRVPVLLLRLMLLSDKSHEPKMPNMPLCGYSRTDTLPQIFCSFSKTVAFVLTRSGQELFRRVVLDRRSTLETRYSIDVPEEVARSARDCATIAAVLLRIAVASDLKHDVRNNVRYNYTADPHVQYYEFQLQLFIDTHLDLILAAEVRGAHNDDAICEPMSATVAMPAEALASNAPVHDILRRSIYERCYPHPLRAPSVGEMPDMTMSTLSADLWTKTSDNTRSRVTELIHNIQSKTQNHRCAGRNIAKMICEMWGYNQPTLNFVLNVLELHSLGNYPGVVFRPGFRARLAVRRSYSLDELKPEPWCAWCHYDDMFHCPNEGCDARNTNKRPKQHNAHVCAMCKQFELIEPKLIAAIREFSVYMIECQMVVDYMMRVDSEWTPFVNVVRLAANESRAYTERMYSNKQVLTTTSLMALQSQQMRAIELVQQCNKSVQRLRKDYMFAELMLRMCDHAHTNLICQTWSGPQKPEDFLLAPIYRSNEPFDDERLTCMNACFARLSHLKDRMWCDVFKLDYVDAVAQVMLQFSGDIVISLLHLIGVSPECCTAIQDLHRNSELRNMPDNSFKSACITLSQVFPVDFHVVHYLLGRIVHHDKFKVMVLDERTAIAQTRALRMRHMIMPWERLPPIDRLYFCEGEFRVYADLIEPLNDDLVQRAVDECCGDTLAVTNAPFGTGAKGALYSHKTNKLHCTRPPSSSIAKKFDRDGFLSTSEFFGDSEETATKQDKSTAKSIRVAQNSQRACGAPLKYVSMIGKLVRIGSHVYTLCTICAGPFAISSSSLSSDGFVCGRHVQLVESERYTELREFVSRHTHEVKCAPRSANEHNDIVPLTQRFTTFERDEEIVHTRLTRIVAPLYAPSHVRPKSEPLDKLYCIATPCFAEEKFRANSHLLSWASQLGTQILSTRVIARRFGVVQKHTEERPLLERRQTDEDALRRTEEAIASMQAANVEEVADRLKDLREKEDRLKKKIAKLNEEIADAERIADAAAAAAEAAEAAETTSGMTLADAERISKEATESGTCLLKVAITCAFCYARCEKNSCFTRLNVIDVDGCFVEPLWQKKIETRGRLDIWLCKNDFNKVEHFIRSRPQVLASDLWDALVEMKKQAFTRRLQYQQGKK